MFVWAKLLNGVDSEKFTDNLLNDKHIFVAPGTVFGSNGKGYVRFSLCADENIINDAIKKISINFNYSYLVIAKPTMLNNEYTNIKEALFLSFNKIK